MRLFLLIILALITIHIQAWEPRISPPASQLNSRATGIDLYLVCQIKEDDIDSDIDQIEISFYKDGERMTKQQIRKNGFIQASLAFAQPSKTDSGEYVCKASVDGEMKEEAVNINFYERAGFINTDSVQHPEDDKDANITCETKGDLLEEIFWYKNGNLIYENDERGYKFHDNDHSHMLFIPSYDSEKDDDNYTCNVVQFAQIYKKEIEVTAYSSPIITVFEIPEGNVGYEGQDAVFKCQATGKPTPVYTWFKHTDDGENIEIKSGDKYHVENGLLKINYLTESDSGDYSCKASNEIGNSTQAVKLSIHKKPRINKMDDIITDIGNNIELLCDINSDSDVTDAYFMFNKQKYAPAVIPTPEDSYEATNDVEENESIEFTENNSQQQNDDDDNENEVDENEYDNDDNVENKRKRRNILDESIIVEWNDNNLVLRINNVQMSHMGKYSCHAQNMAGYGHDTAKILVKHRPEFINTSDKYIRRKIGESASINCQISAVPAATLKIDHEGSKVYADGTNIIIDETEDKINVKFNNLKESDFGKYQCTAKNSEGTAEPAEFILIKIQPPKMPDSILCTEQIYPNYAICQMMGYSENRGEWPTYFEVYYVQQEEQPDEFDWESEANIVEINYDGDGEIRIPSLMPRANYFAKFRAVNEAGRSDISDIIQFETTTPWTPEPVTDAIIDCPDVCSVNWTAPNDRGSPITGYKLVFREIKPQFNEDIVDENEMISIEASENQTTENEEEEDDEENNENNNEESQQQLEEEQIETEEQSTENLDDEDNDNEIIIDVGPSSTHVDLPQLLPLRNYQLLIFAQNDEGDSQPVEYYFRTTEHSGLATLFPLPNWFIICLIVTFIIFTACSIDAFCCKTRQCGILACLTSHRRNRIPKDIEQGNPTTENRGLLSEKHQNE